MSGAPFEREPTPAPSAGTPAALAGWAAPASYLGLEPQVVAELVRSALSSPAMATLRDGELAVGAMLVSLALRGEDAALDQVLPLDAELRLLRYSVGQLSPIAVHPVGSLGDLLRSLAHCAAGLPGETWEAVANAGTGEPVAIASARNHELRWLQPPAPGSHNAAAWAAVTTTDAPPGSSAAEWQVRLTAPPPPAPSGPAPLPASSTLLNDPFDQRSRSAPVPAFPSGAGYDVVSAVTAAVGDLLANAPLELELDAATLDQLRDTAAIEKLVEAVDRLDRHLGQVDAVTRQVTALTTAVDDLADSTRSLLRHQWDNMPPQGFWLRVQKADDEVRRAVDELAAEVRSRLRPNR